MKPSSFRWMPKKSTSVAADLVEASHQADLLVMGGWRSPSYLAPPSNGQRTACSTIARHKDEHRSEVVMGEGGRDEIAVGLDPAGDRLLPLPGRWTRPDGAGTAVTRGGAELRISV
jgi:hypothetical protein